MTQCRTRRTLRRRTRPVFDRRSGGRPLPGRDRPPSCASRWPSVCPPSCMPVQPRLTPRATRRTLPDDCAPAAEQRRTDTHVCRTFRDRLLQVPAHARGDHHRAGWAARTTSATSRSIRNDSAAGTSSGATAMTPPRERASSAAIASASVHDLRAERASPGPGRRPGSTCTRQVTVRPAALARAPRASTSRSRSTEWIDVGVRDHAGGLVGLQLTDEVPGQRQAQGGSLGGLGRRLLIPVLADVTQRRAR